MASNPHFKPYIVDEAGNPVFEIPRSTNTIFYRYETRIVDRMPVPGRPRSKSALEKLKEVIKVPDELLRIPGNILGAPKARPVSWGGAPRGEGRYYYVDPYGRTIETAVTRTPNPPAPPAPPAHSGYPVQNQAPHAHGGSLTHAVKVAKDKDVVADAAERANHAALFARMGSGGMPGSSGGSNSAAGATGGSGVSGGGSSGGGGFLDGSSLFDW